MGVSARPTYGPKGTHCVYCDRKIRRGQRSKWRRSICKRCAKKMKVFQEIEDELKES